jgi:hypothetical protein
MLWYARSQRSWASGRSSAARRIRHSRFIVSSVPTDLGGRIFRAHGEHVDPRRCREAQPSRPAEREPPAPGHAEFIFCDQSIERTNSWSNAHKKLVWCTKRRGRVVNFWVTFSNVIIIVGRLIREAWSRYRWETRPTRRP